MKSALPSRRLSEGSAEKRTEKTTLATWLDDGVSRRFGCDKGDAFQRLLADHRLSSGVGLRRLRAETSSRLHQTEVLPRNGFLARPSPRVFLHFQGHYRLGPECFRMGPQCIRPIGPAVVARGNASSCCISLQRSRFYAFDSGLFGIGHPLDRSVPAVRREGTPVLLLRPVVRSRSSVFPPGCCRTAIFIYRLAYRSCLESSNRRGMEQTNVSLPAGYQEDS